MKKEMKAKYDPKTIEEGKYEDWLKNKYFEAGDKSKEPFTIVIPPPNVTGKLHIGHAFDISIQDMIIRRKRMQGYDALYLPGMDHAGIATQAKIEEKLRSQNIDKYVIGREKFLKHAWDWKEEYSIAIRKQWAKLGLSLDYSRECFTLDKNLNEAVNHIFISLYNKGYIYQGNRIISWDSQAKTALSNIEVEYKELEGALYHIKYPLVDNKGYLIVATTRPETMFADQAIMINPEDKRYAKYLGQEVYIPTTKVKIPIISDSYVDMSFGTGCVKVTPAHDSNDFEVGLRHNLRMPLCMDESSIMNEMAFKYQGLDRFECRKQLINDLKEMNLLEKIEKIVHAVGHSERTGVVVEPRLSKQWFLKMDGLAKQVLKNDEYKFYPQRFVNVLNKWLENIHDWCISRQLWWGHQIPAWYKKDEVKVQSECPGEGWVQDEDVLDTWFSSALWPFSTLGWPSITEDYKRYYPTNVLVTGYDIIFFWVSRMLFTGLEFTNKAPFSEILIHGLIRDNNGKKMSKSLGNGIDPFEVSEKYGTDSLRYFLNTNSAPGSDLRYDETKLESSWNYLNKLWNISRFVIMNTFDVKRVDLTKQDLNLSSKWILSKLNNVISEVDLYFDKYEFTEVAKVLYNFVWEDFASWYVEVSKVDLANSDETSNNVKNVLIYVLKTIVKMLHPYIPFITEEIYQSIPNTQESIMISNWPKVNNFFNFNEVADFEVIKDIIVNIRNQRSLANKAPSKPILMIIECKNDNIKTLLETNINYLNKFCNPKELLLVDKYESNEDNVVIVLKDINIYIPTSDLVDINEVYVKLLKEKETLAKEISRAKGMLSNEKFISKAPLDKVEAEKDKLSNYERLLEDVLKHISQIESKR